MSKASHAVGIATGLQTEPAAQSCCLCKQCLVVVKTDVQTTLVMGCKQTFLIVAFAIDIIGLVYSRSMYSKEFKRQITPLSPAVWELGLREAAHQALVKEKQTNPRLRESLMSAPLIGRRGRSNLFGDIAILAKGQLLSTPNGYRFTQDSTENDCIDCHENRRPRRIDSDIYQPHNQNRLMALWTVRRIRHRDENRGHKFELEYIISPVNSPFRFSNVGQEDERSPGHVFVVKMNTKSPNSQFFQVYSQGNDKYITNTQFITNQNSQFSSITYNLPRPTTSNKNVYYGTPATVPSILDHHYKKISGVRYDLSRKGKFNKPTNQYLPQVLPQEIPPLSPINIPSNQYLPYKPPATVPTVFNFPTTPVNYHRKEIDLYKKLLLSLAQKTSTTKFTPQTIQSPQFSPPTKSTVSLTFPTTKTVFHSTRPSTVYLPPTASSTVHTKPAQHSTTVFVPIQPPLTQVPHTSVLTTSKVQFPVTQPYKTTVYIPSSDLSAPFHTDTIKTTPYIVTQPKTTASSKDKNSYFTISQQTTNFPTKQTTYYLPTNKQTSEPPKSLTSNLTPTKQTFESTKYPTLSSIPEGYYTISKVPQSTTFIDMTKSITPFYIDPSHLGYPKTTPTTPFTDIYDYHKFTGPAYIPNIEINLTTQTQSPPTSFPTLKPTTLQLSSSSDRYFPQTTPHYIDIPSKLPKPETPFKKPTKPSFDVIDEDEEEDLEIFPEDKFPLPPKPTTEFPKVSTGPPKPTEEFLKPDEDYKRKHKITDEEIEEFDKLFTTRNPSDIETTKPVTINTQEIDEIFEANATIKPRRNETFEEFFGTIPVQNFAKYTTVASAYKKDRTENSSAFQDFFEDGLPENLILSTPGETSTPPIKIIYSNFYTAAYLNTTESSLDEFTSTVETQTLDDVKRNSKLIRTPPSTSQSYSTSVSFEINKYNTTNSTKTSKYRKGGTNNNTKKESVRLQELALSVANHAKSIDYLTSKTKNLNHKRRNHTRLRKNKSEIK